LFFQEEAQMFQFSGSYFQQYMNRPSGISGYLASFLIQFFRYPAAGGCIYAVVFYALYKAFQCVLRKFSLFEKSLFIPAVPSLLFLPASTHIQFDFASQLSFIIALAGFAVLTAAAKRKYYYLYVPALTVLLYLLAGGNVFITVVLFVFYSLTCGEKKWKPCLLSTVVSALVPFLLLHVAYPVPFREAFLGSTPFHKGKPEGLFLFYAASWLSVVLLPFIGILFRKICAGMGRWKYLLVADAGLSAIVIGVILWSYNPNMENVIKMIYHAEKEQWEKVLTTSAELPAGHYSCFYANLALQKTGEMGEKMFRYNQTDASGLFLVSEDMISCYMMSDLFYQMGVINESQQYAFESMMGFMDIKEANLLNVKRLVSCAALRKDVRLVSKYQGILDKTLFYGNCAQKYKSLMAEDAPLTESGDTVNVFGKSLLISILKNNPRHKMAFEYLMAYYLLDADYEGAKNCFDTYYSNFDYANIPTHYAEFLILYAYINRAGTDFFEKYPLPGIMREDFEAMNLLLMAKRNNNIINTLEKQFKGTYWFYIQFPLIASQKK
jgi:hypothetical protein